MRLQIETHIHTRKIEEERGKKKRQISRYIVVRVRAKLVYLKRERRRRGFKSAASTTLSMSRSMTTTP